MEHIAGSGRPSMNFWIGILNGSLILLDFVATILPLCAVRVLNVPSCLIRASCIN